MSSKSKKGRKKQILHRDGKSSSGTKKNAPAGDKNDKNHLALFIEKYLPYFVFTLILLVVSIIRLRLAEVPLERDEGEYAYAAQLILQGLPP